MSEYIFLLQSGLPVPLKVYVTQQHFCTPASTQYRRALIINSTLRKCLHRSSQLITTTKQTLSSRQVTWRRREQLGRIEDIFKSLMQRNPRAKYTIFTNPLNRNRNHVKQVLPVIFWHFNVCVFMFCHLLN